VNDTASRIAHWREHPPAMVRELFNVTPDAWQDEVLEAFPRQTRIAMKACKGPGKTTVLAWCAWNFLLTRPRPKIAATSISKANLDDGLWTEMAKWHNVAPVLRDQFTWTKTRIFHNGAPEEWYMSARSWSQSADATRQADTLAGLHADYILFIIDESGGVPAAIMPTAEAALAGGPKEAHIIQAGNPIALSGPLYRACTTSRDLWYVVEITGDPDDPKRSPRIPIEYARDQIRQYGKDNPWVLVNIFGKFPPSAFNVLIGPDEVSAAMKRYYREHEIGAAPKVMGVDVARFGDDASVLAPRQGIQMLPLKKWRNLDSTQGAGQVSRFWADWNADACFIDATGGMGAGWLDQVRAFGKSPIGVEFAGQAHDPFRYYNKRTEMAFDFVEWIKRGGALPDDPNLLAALTQTTYSFKGDRLLLEPKELVKIKVGASPDEMDACMMTFAEPITPKAKQGTASYSAAPAEYNPFRDLERAVQQSYDPWGR
jgi:phage terminase large subunit